MIHMHSLGLFTHAQCVYRYRGKIRTCKGFTIRIFVLVYWCKVSVPGTSTHRSSAGRECISYHAPVEVLVGEDGILEVFVEDRSNTTGCASSTLYVHCRYRTHIETADVGSFYTPTARIPSCIPYAIMQTAVYRAKG